MHLSKGASRDAQGVHVSCTWTVHSVFLDTFTWQATQRENELDLKIIIRITIEAGAVCVACHDFHWGKDFPNFECSLMYTYAEVDTGTWIWDDE